MSSTYSIKQLLQIKDENITLKGDCFEEKKQGLMALIFPAKLSYTPSACEVCGIKNDQHQVIKHACKPTDIQLLPMGNRLTYLRLNRQRFKCKECGCTFSAQTSIVDKGHYIAKSVIHSIALDLKNRISMKDIAKRHFVSSKTIERVLKSYRPQMKMNFSWLPRVLLVDEFKGMSQTEGAMCFICTDGETGKIVDILSDRRLFQLVQHFQRYSLAARQQVKYLVMDMNASYQQLVQKVFHGASIIIDRFHIVQQLTRALNKERIDVMNQLNRHHNEEVKTYRKLKKYWRTLLKKNKHIDYTSYKHWPLFQRKLVCESEVLDTLLRSDEPLRKAYDIYQQLLYDFEHRDGNSFFDTIKHLPTGLSADFKKKVTYLLKHEDGIRLAFVKPYSNAKIEAKNNIIKVMKRIAFGFRNFENLKLRILIQQNIIETA